MARSIGKYKRLVRWNLIKGRSAYVTNLHESAEFVRWSPDGAHYAVGLGRRVDLYSVATAAIVVKVIMVKASSIYAQGDRW